MVFTSRSGIAHQILKETLVQSLEGSSPRTLAALKGRGVLVNTLCPDTAIRQSLIAIRIGTFFFLVATTSELRAKLRIRYGTK